jgi:hypothetical protein
MMLQRFRAISAVGACVGGLLLFIVPFKAAESLPAKLDDDAFWRMITEFSEDGGFFRFENFLSNELGFQFVIPELKEITKPGGVYLGVGPEQNFTYIAAIRPHIAFITDIRRQNMLELLMYKALFELSPDRAEFVSRLFARRRADSLNADSTPEQLFDALDATKLDPQLFRKNLSDIRDVLINRHRFGLSTDDLSTIDYVYRVFADGGPYLDYQAGGFAGGGSPTYADLMTMTDGQGTNRSYLATEESYRMLREMEMKNLIVPIVGDFGGPKAIRAIGQYLKEHEATVTAFYLSNVEQYLFQENGWRRFYTNVAMLPIDSSSQFIRTVNGGTIGRQSFRGFGMRFETLLSPIADVITAFKEGRVRYYGDIINMSHR